MVRTQRTNEGLKLTAEEVAHGIVQDPEGRKDHLRRARPGAFAVDGGPSIAERMGKIGAHFGRADNKRVAQMGALGGWDQMRARLKGDGDGRPMIYTFSTCGFDPHHSGAAARRGQAGRSGHGRRGPRGGRMALRLHVQAVTG
jgi:hypothetical protein